MKKLAGVIGYAAMAVFLLWLLLSLGVIKLGLPGAGHVVLGKGRVVQGSPDTAPAVIVVETAVPVIVVETMTPVPTLVVLPASTEDVAADLATREFWASCALKQARGQRVSPRCPANAGELLGVGR